MFIKMAKKLYLNEIENVKKITICIVVIQKLSTSINQDVTQLFQTHLQLVYKLQTSSIQNQMAGFEQVQKRCFELV